PNSIRKPDAGVGQMEPHSLTGAYSDGGSQVLWEDGERVFRRGWRLDDNGKRDVLLVMPPADQPSRSSFDRLTHDYGLKDEVERAAVGQTRVVEVSYGGLIDRLPGTLMQVGRLVQLANGRAVALGKLRKRGLVHKDIKPANILVNSTTDEVRLTGFGIAARV